MYMCVYLYTANKKNDGRVVQCCGQCFTHPFGFYDLKKKNFIGMFWNMYLVFKGDFIFGLLQ